MEGSEKGEGIGTFLLAKGGKSQCLGRAGESHLVSSPGIYILYLCLHVSNFQFHFECAHQCVGECYRIYGKKVV